MQPTWQDADKAYQLHHVNCPTCAAAGRKPGELQRCPTGSELWEQYLDLYTRDNPPRHMPSAHLRCRAQAVAFKAI